MLEVWQDARLYHALARGMIVAGQLMWIETMGGHVAQAQGVVIVGSSNWAADTSLKGIVHDLTVLSTTTSTSSCFRTNRTFSNCCQHLQRSAITDLVTMVVPM
jgi:hypothetical protein